MRGLRRAALKALLVTSCLAAPGMAMAQEAEPQELEDIIITGEIQYRNRTDTVAPELVYGQEFFAQFEPLSVGDQLARVPGVAFTSDIGERDAPQLRGLGEGFTQVLVNGRPIPGAGNDRTVFVDRIPAEIIDRVEIVRSPSADIDSQGVGGTINIILRDGMSLPPGVIARAGVNYNIDNERYTGLGALSYSDRNEERTLAWSATIDVQQRYNVKILDQQVFDDTSPGFGSSFNGLDLFEPDAFDPTDPLSTAAVEHSDQIDTRESFDLSFNGDVTWDFRPGHSLRFDGFFVRTDREETEDGQIFERDDGDGNDDGDVTNEDWEGPEFESQLTNILQQNIGGSVLYEGQLTPGWSFESEFRYSRFTEETDSTDFEEETPIPVELELIETEDNEYHLDGAFTFNSDDFAQRIGLHGFEFRIGAVGRLKTRDYSQRLFEDDDEDGAFDGPDDEVTLGSGVFNYEERRFDAFMLTELQLSESLTFQAGIRMEHTETEASLPDGTNSESDSTEFNPSAHLQWAIGENGQLRMSAARTVRRPGLNQLVPFEDDESPGDEDITVGNPGLGFETAIGWDIGYEHRIGRRGVIGFNIFERQIEDLISLVATCPPGCSGEGDGQFFTYQNTGDGRVWGWEVDLSTPLDFIGLPNTGVFFNYTNLDSERTDPVTGIESRFNAQPEYVYNYGITHNIPSWNTSFGFSYQRQGRSVSTFLGEIEEQWYDGNLEAFVEHRFGENVVMRLTGFNLLDADSIQAERGYDGDSAGAIADAMINNEIDAFEVERENSSPSVTLTLRAVF